MVVFEIPNVKLLHAIDFFGLLMQNCLMRSTSSTGCPRTSEIKPDDRPKLVEFATFMLIAIDEDETFLQRIYFSDEATFYVNGCVNRHSAAFGERSSRMRFTSMFKVHQK